jgi:hypothetical protein
MENASPFLTLTFHKKFNDIKKAQLGQGLSFTLLAQKLKIVVEVQCSKGESVWEC